MDWVLSIEGKKPRSLDICDEEEFALLYALGMIRKMGYKYITVIEREWNGSEIVRQEPIVVLSQPE